MDLGQTHLRLFHKTCDRISMRNQSRACTKHAFVLLLIVSLCMTVQLADAISTDIEDEHKNPSRPELPILDQLFPSRSLDKAWERYPLLSTFSRDGSTTSTSNACLDDDDSRCTSSMSVEKSDSSTTTTLSTIYTSSSSLENRLNMFGQIFNLKNVSVLLDTITRDPESEHQRHYQVIKKVVETHNKNGHHHEKKERNGMLPAKKLDVPTIHKAMSQGHFSLIVNNVQHWWGTVAQMSRNLRHETMCGYVSCNLYLTPPASKDERVKSGFEAHYDWMDVVVLQLEGTKVWSVASEPTTYLPNPDQNRNVNDEQLQRYRTTKYDDIILQPGDVLYIPRGFVHNASTTFQDDDDTTTTTTKSTKSKPSLHLTFGIEHGCATTMEMLLHRALDAFVQQQNGMSIAIPQHRCQSDQDISWDMVLHASIMGVARTVPCESSSVPENDNTVQGKTRSDPCELRKGVPFHPVWSHVVSTQQQHRVGGDLTKDDMLLASFLESLEAVTKYATVQRTAAFVHSIQTTSDDTIYSCLPRILPSIDILLCSPAVTSGLYESEFTKYVQRFVGFAKTNLPTAISMLNGRMEHENLEKVRNEDEKLRSLDQAIY